MDEKFYAEEVLLSEANGYRSREKVTLVAGQNLTMGAVLGKITASGKYKIADNVTPASDGSQTAVAVLLRDCDASGGDAEAVIIARDAEVKKDLLTYVAGSDANDIAAINAQLAAVGIIVR